MDANQRQVGGDHYRSSYQHWDFVEEGGLGYLEGCATKYVSRWRQKNGVQDLEKAEHYVQKLVELCRAGIVRPRGVASLEQIIQFCAANHLWPIERHVVGRLANWKSVEELEDALEKLRFLLDAARDGQPLSGEDVIEGLREHEEKHS